MCLALLDILAGSPSITEIRFPGSIWMLVIMDVFPKPLEMGGFDISGFNDLSASVLVSSNFREV